MKPLNVKFYYQHPPEARLVVEEANRISDRDTHRPNFKSSQKNLDIGEFTNEYWHEAAKQILDEHLKKQPNTNKAKNLIFFLGDGMSHASVGKLKNASSFSVFNHLINQLLLEYT